MALGEAFVNVRANLKPFSQDLEKGIRAILREAERRIAAEGGTGHGIAAALARQTGQGVQEGLDQGFDRGARSGTRKALTTGQRFFAALADFADDGLSAIPAKVKAAIVIGIGAASLLVAPLLGGAMAAAVTTAIAAGAVAGGIALASQFQAVRDQFTAVGRQILDDLRGRASVFIEPLQQGALIILDAFEGVGDRITDIFANAARQVEPFTRAFTGLVRELLPGIAAAVRQARPLIEALVLILPRLGRDFAAAISIIADGSPEAVIALRDIVAVIGQLIIGLALTVRNLTEVYFWMRVIGALASGDTGTAIQLLTDRERAATLASGQLAAGLGGLNQELGQTAAEAKAAREAITALLTAQLRGINATIDFEEAYDDLQKSIREGNRDFRVTEETGRTNLRLVEQLITAAARRRDEELLHAQETGRTTAEINAAYQAQLDQVEKVIGGNIRQDQTLQQIIETARAVPREVATAVSTPGLGSAIIDFRRLAAAIRSAAQAGAEYLRRGASGGGLQIVPQYAMGAILAQPTLGLLAEAGYREAVIPDPRVKPQRALELANEFGLTALIAETLGRGATVVNVYLGAQKLEQFVDYRIEASNQANATALAQRPRG